MLTIHYNADYIEEYFAMLRYCFLHVRIFVYKVFLERVHVTILTQPRSLLKIRQLMGNHILTTPFTRA